MKVSDLTIIALKPYVTGDDSPTPRMSGNALVNFFNAFGFNDEYSKDGLPNGWTRNEYALERLKELNGRLEFKGLVEALTDRRKVDDPDVIAIDIAELIKHDGYLLDKNDLGIYKVTGTELVDPVLIEAHFQEIKQQIIENIQNAKFTIWIAVAWFTDRDIGNELRNKHRAGINVRVIVNDDETTDKYGLKFDEKGIEYSRVTPKSRWGKKLMHNKFCIIDLCKVIHGSYNWTSNAQYNNESITIVESRELAEGFSCQFIELKNQKST